MGGTVWWKPKAFGGYVNCGEANQRWWIDMYGLGLFFADFNADRLSGFKYELSFPVPFIIYLILLSLYIYSSVPSTRSSPKWNLTWCPYIAGWAIWGHISDPNMSYAGYYSLHQSWIILGWGLYNGGNSSRLLSLELDTLFQWKLRKTYKRLRTSLMHDGL